MDDRLLGHLLRGHLLGRRVALDWAPLDRDLRAPELQVAVIREPASPPLRNEHYLPVQQLAENGSLPLPE